MSLTKLIRSSESSVKVAQSVVEALSVKYGFKADEAWTVICDKPAVDVLKKMRRARRKAEPTSAIKKPRTAFSYFTQSQRAGIQAKNPTATFGDLSRLVSTEWKKLSEDERRKYKEMETTDRSRYETERASFKANVETQNASTASASVDVVVAPAVPADASAPKRSPKRSPKQPVVATSTTPSAVVPTPVVTATPAVVVTPVAAASPKKPRSKNVPA